ncbi:MAG: poly-gamma-glutamate biosynthesis protein PgsC [Cetobacterium sp.]|uniref:poly-gamma-glutamate biosynthesis protein PgsC n=1 Tax=Cetobacterium sp. ZOR0034 TaxID=1339239 RepID=UPI000645FEB6|nr:poly-gamma-glutamate biosynthesis protein PgsC [Cetobacterium sp. ZOR0034]
MNESIVIIGVLLSILFYEVSELSPGGLIVPGYFALFSNDHKRILATILVAFLVLVAVRFLEKYLIIYGRRRFAIYIIITFLLKRFMGELDFEILIGGEVIGLLIPAILAQDLDRNGVKKTLPALLILTGVIKSIIIISGSFI